MISLICLGLTPPGPSHQSNFNTKLKSSVTMGKIIVMQSQNKVIPTHIWVWVLIVQLDGSNQYWVKLIIISGFLNNFSAG